MPAARVVPTFQEFKNRQPCLDLRLEFATVQKLAFQRREEALAHRVVETVADRSHRRPYPHLATPLTERNRRVLDAIRVRFEQCGLELHPVKTRIVYCKDDNRHGKHEHIAFDFLGYTFQPRRAKNRQGEFFVSFLPAISTKAATAIRATIRQWRMASARNNHTLEDLARLVNPSVRGWMNYYGWFYRSKCLHILRHLNQALAAWARRKYKRLQRRKRASVHWLGLVARRDPTLFVLWTLGAQPEAGS